MDLSSAPETQDLTLALHADVPGAKRTRGSGGLTVQVNQMFTELWRLIAT